MIIFGKLIGLLLGLPFGIFGILLGTLTGALVDQLLQIQRNQKDLERFFLQGEFVPRLQRFMRPGAAIALINRLISIDQVPDDELKRDTLQRIDEFFLVRTGDQQRMEQLWEKAWTWVDRIDIPWLVRVYGVSSPEYLQISQIYSYGGESERDFLFTLCHQIAGRDENGISREEFSFICELFEPMGLSVREIEQRLRSVPYLSKNNCRIMGIETDCNESELRKRYRHLASRLHPDSHINIGYDEREATPEQIEERQLDFARMQEAYTELLWQLRFED